MNKTAIAITATFVALLFTVAPLQATDPLQVTVAGDSNIPECSTGSPLECERTTTTTCLHYTWVKVDGTVAPSGGGAGATRECQTKQEKVQTRYWSR